MVFAIVFSVSLVAHAETRKQAPKKRTKVINKIVAVVNNEVITEIEVNHRLAAEQVSGNKEVDDKAKRRATIESLINDKMMNQILKASDIEVTKDDLARAIGNVLHTTGMTIDQLRAEVAAKGMTYDEYKDEVKKQIQRIMFINQVIGPQVKITEQDIRDYYQRHQENFRGSSKAHIAQIFLSFAGVTSQTDADQLRRTSLNIVAQARKGKNFTELARKYSKGPNAENGGDLGMISLKDISPSVSETVRNMRVGDVSNPIFTEQGLIIVKLISLPELSPQDFMASRDRIYQAIYEERVDETLQAYLQKERQRAFIEIR